MKVLLSIRPEYAEKILSGEKKFEFRRILPKNRSVSSVIIYATMPIGKIIGEFEIEDFLSTDPSSLWKLTEPYAGITQDFFDTYFDGRDTAHAIKVKSVKRYKKAKLLSDILPNGVPPQSFCYV